MRWSPEIQTKARVKKGKEKDHMICQLTSEIFQQNEGKGVTCSKEFQSELIDIIIHYCTMIVAFAHVLFLMSTIK